MSVQSQKPNPMFQTYDSFEEALTNANTLISGLPQETHLAAFTAVYGILNTGLRLVEEATASPTTSIPQVTRQLPSDPNLHMQFVIKDLKPLEALQILRNELAWFVTLAMKIHQSSAPVGAEVLTLVMLVAQLLGLPPETVEQEVKELHIQRLVNALFPKS